MRKLAAKIWGVVFGVLGVWARIVAGMLAVLIYFAPLWIVFAIAAWLLTRCETC